MNRESSWSRFYRVGLVVLLVEQDELHARFPASALSRSRIAKHGTENQLLPAAVASAPTRPHGSCCHWHRGSHQLLLFVLILYVKLQTPSLSVTLMSIHSVCWLNSTNLSDISSSWSLSELFFFSLSHGVFWFLVFFFGGGGWASKPILRKQMRKTKNYCVLGVWYTRLWWTADCLQCVRAVAR